MPTSWMEAIPDIIEEVSRLNPDSILDIGIGFGKYGLLLREKLEIPEKRYSKQDWKIQIDGIEAFRNYQNPIHDYVYNKIYYEAVENCLDHLSIYDVVLLVDVLEHFEKETGKEIIRKVLAHTKKALIVSTPLYPAEQLEYLSNHYEEHKSRWMQVDFAEFDFEYKLIRVKKNGAQIFVFYPAEQTKKELPFDFIPSQIPQKSEGQPLTIAYFLPHKNLTGGVKMLLEQMKHLRKKGHKIHAYLKGNPGESALPDWFDIEVDKEIIVPNGETFLSKLDGNEDVGVAGWLEQTTELANAKFPVVYWEQGNEYLFGEWPSPELRNVLQKFYQQPVALTAASPTIAKILFSRFGRVSPVIPNGIDTDLYRPGDRPNENVILLVGNPNLMFKGFDVAVKVLARLWQSGQKFKVKWACQTEPSLAKLPLPFPIEYIVMPSQEKLAECFRQADVFLFTSWYEGFGMPPLEAMASGVPVVATRCGGIEVYAKDKINSLLADPGDVEALTIAVTLLLNSPALREALGKTGRETALVLSFSNMVKYVEDYLRGLVSYKKMFLQKKTMGHPHFNNNDIIKE